MNEIISLVLATFIIVFFCLLINFLDKYFVSKLFELEEEKYNKLFVNCIGCKHSQIDGCWNMDCEIYKEITKC